MSAIYFPTLTEENIRLPFIVAGCIVHARTCHTRDHCFDSSFFISISSEWFSCSIIGEHVEKPPFVRPAHEVVKYICFGIVDQILNF